MTCQMPVKGAGAFPQARVVRFGHAGYFIPEESPDNLVREMRTLIG